MSGITMVELMNGGNVHHVGMIPSFFDTEDEDSASEQINKRYSYGGGWRPFSKRWKFDHQTKKLTFPAASTHERDEVYIPRALIELRDEQIFIYDHAWVAIVQPDGTFEVSRVD